MKLLLINPHISDSVFELIRSAAVSHRYPSSRTAVCPPAIARLLNRTT